MVNPTRLRPPAALIFNPVAGRGRPEDLLTIRECLEPFFSLRVHETTEEVGAAACARAALDHGATLVVASGGDGTVGAVAETLLHTGIPLGIIPTGTANSLSVALGLPHDIVEACAVITSGRARAIDTARCNGRVMALMVSMGVHAETIGDTPRELKNRYGRLAYFMQAMQTLREPETFRITIETESERIQAEATAVTVANVAPVTTIFAQGPAVLVPDDGLLDVTIISVHSRLEALATGVHLLASATRELPATRENVGFLQARSLRLHADPPQRLMVDGEPAGEGDAVIECVPGSLRVMVG